MYAKKMLTGRIVEHHWTWDLKKKIGSFTWAINAPKKKVIMSELMVVQEGNWSVGNWDYVLSLILLKFGRGMPRKVHFHNIFYNTKMGKYRTHDSCKHKAVIQAPYNHVNTTRGGKKSLTWATSRRLRRQWGRWNLEMVSTNPSSKFPLQW